MLWPGSLTSDKRWLGYKCTFVSGSQDLQRSLEGIFTYPLVSACLPSSATECDTSRVRLSWLHQNSQDWIAHAVSSHLRRRKCGPASVSSCAYTPTSAHWTCIEAFVLRSSTRTRFCCEEVWTLVSALHVWWSQFSSSKLIRHSSSPRLTCSWHLLDPSTACVYGVEP
jgi:hypothetical protein